MDKDVRTMKCYSVIKRNKIVPSAEMWTDPEIIIWSEERKKNSSIKYHIILLICGIQKKGTDEHSCKAETETDVENLWTPTGKVGMG